jgi:hypothetical protein
METYQGGGIASMKKAEENSEDLAGIVRDWIELEDRTIASAEELIRKTNNTFVQMRMEMVKHDSGKHKVMLQWILDNLTREATPLTPDDVAPISALLHKHLEVEVRSIDLANSALKKSRLRVVNDILSALLEDETRHHAQILQLDEEVKKAVYNVA